MLLLAVLEGSFATYAATFEAVLRYNHHWQELNYAASDLEDPWVTWNRNRNLGNLTIHTIFLDFYRPNVFHKIFEVWRPRPQGRREIVVYANGKDEAQLSKDCRTQVVLGVSMVAFLFLLRSLKVARPKGFEGDLLQHDMTMGGGC